VYSPLPARVARAAGLKANFRVSAWLDHVNSSLSSGASLPFSGDYDSEAVAAGFLRQAEHDVGVLIVGAELVGIAATAHPRRRRLCENPCPD